MDIAVIGAGSVGTALATAWAARGRRVVAGVRKPEDDKHAPLRERGVDIASVADAAASAPVVVLATPWPETLALVAALDLAGKTVIDTTNPVGFGANGMEVLATGQPSAGEDVAAAAPDAFVFKTLNQIGANIMDKAALGPARPLMLVAGDHAERKRAVIGLVAELGFDVRDTGALSMARHLESLAVLWITQAFTGPLGRDFALVASPWPALDA